MSVAVKLAGYGLVLAAAFGAAVGVGSAVGPISASTPSTPAHSTSHTANGMNDMSDPTHPAADTMEMPGMGHGETTPQGLAVSTADYALVPVSTMLPTGGGTTFRYRRKVTP